MISKANESSRLFVQNDGSLSMEGHCWVGKRFVKNSLKSSDIKDWSQRTGCLPTKADHGILSLSPTDSNMSVNLLVRHLIIIL